MPPVMGEHETAVFHRYAEYLWRRAGGIATRWTIAGTVAGAGLGAVMLTSWAHWPVPHRQAYLLVALGAIAGCVLGRSIGVAKALGLRLQAQLAQHQLEFERMTLALVAASQKASEPVTVSPAPYVPAGVPLVSAAAPVEAEPEDEHGWGAIEPLAS